MIVFQESENKMKYFKVQADRRAQRYHIDKKTFDEITERKRPFEQRNINGKISQYAICPSCLNPIQLIGLSHEIRVSPHGKHTGKDINGLPEWKQRKYEYCPFARHNEYIPPNDDDLLEEIDQSVIDLYDILKEQFDKVVYVVQKELHIRCSERFWTDALQAYLVNRVYLYPWLSEANLPYIFAYRGMQHMRCFGQQFEEGSEIYNALSNLQSVRLERLNENSGYFVLRNENGHFINLIFRFTNHCQNAVEGESLNESMMFYIDNADTGQVVYEQRISFSETFFTNIINSENATRYRNMNLLGIAEELMQPLS